MFRLIFLLLALTAAFAEEKYVPVRDGVLYTDRIGHGDPIIVIHGSPALTQTYLRPAFDALAQEHQVIFYDQRGCGKSTGISHINMATFLDDLDAIRKTAGAEKVTLIGHSWGGLVAMHYAIRHPEAVNKLILMSTAPASKEEFDLFIVSVMKRLEPIHDELQKIESTESYKSGDPETVEKQMRLVFSPYFYNPQDVAKVDFSLTQSAFLSGQKVFSLLCEEVFFKPYDLYPELASIKAPTLVLHGDYDPIPKELAEHIAKTLPNGHYVEIERCGHFPYAEKPDETFNALNTFLKR